jgi:predicted membrane chloride channel (bestrophin family)
VETFFSAITFALTLMLVFKTNSSYSRWWEARSKVGMLTSTAHDLARAVSRAWVMSRLIERLRPGKHD